MSISKLSGDFPVNSTLTNNQDRSAVIALADGRFFVTWTDDQASGVDPSGLGIWGAWFNADGSRSIDPFVMNPTTNANQNNSAAAQLSNGNVVVAWQDGSQTAGDNSLTAIRARILGPNGAQLVGEIVLNSTTANLQTQVSLAALPDGGFVATFTDHSAGSGTIAAGGPCPHLQFRRHRKGGGIRRKHDNGQ